MEEERKLVSIVFTDIKGYTALMENDEAIAISTVERFEKYTREICAKYHGTIINFMGDGAFLIFDNSMDALDFALEIQTIFIQKENIQHRIGINTGEVVLKEEHVYGDSVNVAARIESLGVPGCVLISDSTYRLIKNKKKFEVKSMGKFHFKNKSERMEVFAVTNEPLAIPQRKDLKGKTEEKKINKWWMFSAALAILLLSIAAFYFANNTPSTQTTTWEGMWDISVQDENKNFKKGELKIDMVNDRWNGFANIWYNQSQGYGIEMTLENIIEEPENNSLSGDWSSDLSDPVPLKGKFEFRMNPSYKEFEGTYSFSNGKESFLWNGVRK
jgi:class 3 adenylate cyclase